MTEFMEDDDREKNRESHQYAEKNVHAEKGVTNRSGTPLRESRSGKTRRSALFYVGHLDLHVVEKVVHQVSEEAEVFPFGSEFDAVRLDSETAVEFSLLIFFESERQADFLVFFRVPLEVGIEFAGNVGFDEAVDGSVVFRLDFLKVLLDLEFHRGCFRSKARGGPERALYP